MTRILEQNCCVVEDFWMNWAFLLQSMLEEMQGSQKFWLYSCAS